MSTFEHDDVIGTLIERARLQIRMGLSHAERREYLAAETWLRPAIATLDSALALIDGVATPPKPLRKLCIVGTVAVPHDPELPDWFERTSGDPDDGAA